MTTQTEQFAARFEAVNEDAIAAVRGCTDEQWRQASASEGWSVAVVAHHIAAVHEAFLGIVESLATGKPLPPRSSMDEVHRGNAQHARDFAEVGKTETVDLLGTNGAAVAKRIRDLRDDQLGRTAGTFGDNELTVAQFVEWVVIGHAAEHLASIRATLAA